MKSYYYIAATWLFISAFSRGDQEIDWPGLTIKLNGEENYMCEGTGKKGLSALTEKDSESIYSWKAFLNCYLWSDGGRIVVNDKIYSLPDRSKGQKQIIEISKRDNSFVCVINGKEISGNLINAKTSPLKPYESEKIQVTHMGRKLDITVSGFIGGYSNNYNSKDPQLSEKQLTILASGVLIKLDQGSVMVWGRSVGEIKKSLEYNAMTGAIKVDGIEKMDSIYKGLPENK